MRHKRMVFKTGRIFVGLSIILFTGSLVLGESLLQNYHKETEVLELEKETSISNLNDIYAQSSILFENYLAQLELQSTLKDKIADPEGFLE